MGLATLASTLYSIQSRKNVPLTTAFSMMIREDMATRFSVFNITKYITKSEFVATLAHAKFGKKTPIQRAEYEQKQKEMEAEKKRELKLEKFQRFTASSVGALNRKINLIAAVTEKNTGLINSLYNDLGYFKGQRKININTINPKNIRVPLRDKTVKGQIDAINKQIEAIKNVKTKPTKVSQKRITKKEADAAKESGLMNFVLSSIIKNPSSLMAMAGGAASRAIGIGGLATQIFSLLNIPKTAGKMIDRFGGKSVYQDNDMEKFDQALTTLFGTVGAYTAVQGTTAITKFLKERAKAKTPNYEKTKRLEAINKATQKFKSSGMSYKEAQAKAGASYSRFTRTSKYLKKWTLLNKIFTGVTKRLPGFAVADVVFELSRISNNVADHANGKLTDLEFKKNVSRSLTEITSTIGFTALGSVVGAAAGSAAFPGIGTLAGGLIGAGSGVLASIVVGEENMAVVGDKLFKLLFEDDSGGIRRTEQVAPQQTQPISKDATGPQQPPIISSGLINDKRIQERSSNDPDFMKEVQRVSDKFQIDPADLLSIMWKESRLLPEIDNPKTGATGLIQFMPDTAKNLGTTTAALKNMTRAEQMKYVEKYFDMVGLPKGSNRGQIYSYVFLPGIAKKSTTGILASKNDPATAKYYNSNSGLDANKDGIITIDDLSVVTGGYGVSRTMLASATPAPVNRESEVNFMAEMAARAGTVAQPPIAELASVAPDKSTNAQISAIAAQISAARIQNQVNTVAKETIKLREKVKSQDEFPTTFNSDMSQYA